MQNIANTKNSEAMTATEENNTTTKNAKKREKRKTCAPKTRRKRKLISDARLVECCLKSAGIVSQVAAMLGVNWHTAEKYINACPKAIEAMNGQRGTICDVAESQLLRIVKDQKHPRNFDACVFLLTTLGKKRGFSQKIEQDISAEVKTNDNFKLIIENN